jgi:hypothetical protein
MKTVYFLGRGYYFKSGSSIGMLYSEAGERYDWGRIELEIEQGKEILIKPATPKMHEWANKRLLEI